MSYAWFVLVAVGVSFLLTGAMRRYAVARSLMDVPNARSSHVLPTPRGGGVAIVLTFLLALVPLLFFGLVSPAVFAACAGAGALIAIIGFMDDHGHIAARWRLLGHFIAAAWAIFWLGGLPAISVLGVELELGWAGSALAVIYLVWMLNLYNFMDGIDGIAGVEAVCACFGACLLYAMSGQSGSIWAPLLLGACVAGFLCWNFPPAKIFMGDAGSGFLGIMLGVLSLQAGWISAQLLWGWLILMGVFIVDATFTLLRRLIRGDRIYEAHRSHAYQFASRRFGKHLPVTLAVGLINLCWLLPIALCVTLYSLDGAIGVLLAYSPLLVLACWFRAGELECPP